MSQALEAIEKSLLTGQWLTNGSDGHSSVFDIARDVVDGAFHKALTAPLSQQIFSVRATCSSEILDHPLDDWLNKSDPSLDDEIEDELLHLTLAVACLHAFVQINWTGPDLDVKPLNVLVFASGSFASLNEDTLNQKSIAELTCCGEPAYHLTQGATFLRLAQILISGPYRHCRSVPWWNLRASMLHQQILDEPVAVPESVFSAVEPLTSSIAADPDLAARLHLECGLFQHFLSDNKSAADYFLRAAKASDLQYELTGALGKRTKYQQNEISQLVLLAESRSRDSDGPQSDNGQGFQDANTSANTFTKLPETFPLNDDTLLEQTEYTPSSTALPRSRLSHLDPSSQPALHPLDQCILLSLCLNVKNMSPSHGLTNEQMSAYVARVVSHPRNWTVHTMALLLRSRLESSRTRTVERSTLQLQALVEQMPTADSALSERLLYVHDIPLPSKWEMEKELAIQFLSLGVVRSALEIFEQLEMWEEVVKCWMSMGNPERGLEIVRDLLEGRKAEAEEVLSRAKTTTTERRETHSVARDAKLWCLLGDLELENAQAHYEKAWVISRQTSGRAMRSLGGLHFNRGEYSQAIMCLRRAVAINPLLHRSWFVLGCACVREEDWEGARVAFSRCVAIDDEDGESWNNLASVYLRMGEGEAPADAIDQGDLDANTEARNGHEIKRVPFSNKLLAFRALKECIKYRYEDWRVWSNYMVVAIDVGELSEACRALARIVEEKSGKVGGECVDEDVLERLVNAVTRTPLNADDAVEGDISAHQTPVNPSEGRGLFRRVSDLFERTILPRVSSPRIFRAYGRLLTWQSRWDEAIRAYLDGYRCSLAGTMEKGETDVKRWQEAVGEVEEIVDLLRNFGSRVEGSKWQLQARSIVRTFIGRTRDFEDEPEWNRLTELQDELRKEE
ncbi:hypothetical protein JAAARDRAFT_187441 [Jaapia argillacea MUCL 33604]|uniref:Uncharacterized protein n=1 Tax=Jaapia argillacea MUCL 33604 TaxID=933084 RepID=A0A067QN52_9AGAM|nr:hypothetical protein JAAARDRAFT_187441 [Jaapia argillacea MUCL 33604]